MTERAAFNVRVRIEAETTSDVWYSLYIALENFREVAPEGVTIGAASLRPARRSPGFEVTMEPKPRRKAK